MDCSEGIVEFGNYDGGESVEDLRRFMEKFILFHLGRDAGVRVEIDAKSILKFSISHPRIKEIYFELDQAGLTRFAQDIPAFEDMLLEQLTAHRQGLSETL